MAITLTNVLSTIREYSFDRFQSATFFVRTREDSVTNAITNPYTMTVYNNDVDKKVVFARTVNGTPETKTFLFSDSPTLGDLLEKFTAENGSIEVIYSGAFIPSQPTNTLLPSSGVVLDKYYPMYRKVYFDDAYIITYFNEYAMRFLRASETYLVTVDWNTEFATMSEAQKQHLCLWVAFHIVDKRRLFELAGVSVQQSTRGGNPMNNGNNGLTTIDSDSFSMTPQSGNITLQVADVFTLSESPDSLNTEDYSKQIPQDAIAPWVVGSDNVLMDYYSFWYRLQMWIRKRFEDLFSDSSLRTDSIIVGTIELDNEQNMFAYFDSYPFIYSPHVRGIRTN